MRVRLLGYTEIVDGDRVVAVNPPRARAVLAYLLLNANRTVPVHELVEAVWGGAPPTTARAQIQAEVAKLRRMLHAAATIVTTSGGYRLELTAGQLDVTIFGDLVEASRDRAAAGDAKKAAALLREAMRLWRGGALADVEAAFAEPARARLEEQRLLAVEDLAEVELGLGRPSHMIAELTELVAQHPLRERLRISLMLALHRDGRTAEALGVARDLREKLVDEHGLDPGQRIVDLEQRILRNEVEPGTDPPTAPSDHPRPAQLPGAPSDFTGRQQQLRALTDLAEATTAVVITGPAGVGKTALAVHWGHIERDRFADGQLYLNLCGHAPVPPVTPIEALARMLHALGLPPERTPVAVDEAAAMYRTLLTNRRVLVLLDNARDADQVRPLLPGTPRSLALITSRNALAGLSARDGARRVGLEVFSPDEGSELISRMLGRARAGAEPAAVAQLAHLCGQLPLALRIAVADLLIQPRLSIAERTTALAGSDRLGSLEVEGDAEAAVRTAFDLSYATLSDVEKRVFRSTGTAPTADVTPESMAVLVSRPEAQVRKALSRLSQLHLMDEASPGRFAMHDLLRLYATERAAVEDIEADRQAGRHRLALSYLHRVNAAARQLYPHLLRLPDAVDTAPESMSFDSAADASQWLDAERANLTTLVAACDDAGPAEMAWRLADGLRGYYLLRLSAADWLVVASTGLRAAQREANLAGQAASHLSLANMYLRQTSYPEALTHHMRAREISRQIGWPEGEAAALGNLSNTYRQTGRPNEALECSLAVLDIFRERGSEGGQATAWGNLGVIYGERGQLDQAASAYAKSLSHYEHIGSASGVAICLANLGEVCFYRGQYEEALTYLGRARRHQLEVGDLGAQTEVLRCLAAVHSRQGRRREAREMAAAALAQARENGHRHYEAEALNTVAAVEHEAGDQAAAIAVYQQALDLSRQLQDRRAQARALTGLADAHRQARALDEALDLAGQALTVARNDGNPLVEGQVHTVLAAIYLDRADHDQARHHAERALVLFADTGHQPGEEMARATLTRATLTRAASNGVPVTPRRSRPTR